ncbi:MAG: ribosome-recycling factor [Bacillus subtilis]|nr:ribosome-recycling factor [Bacillus subtilis]
MFERVTVDYYSVETPINQVASITSPEGNQIYVKPYDKSLVSKIEKAILAGNFGITPVNDGMGVRLMFPPLTEERRRDAVKSIRRMAEEIKNGIRSIRRDAIEKIKKLEKEAHLPEDDLEILAGRDPEADRQVQPQGRTGDRRQGTRNHAHLIRREIVLFFPARPSGVEKSRRWCIIFTDTSEVRR